MPKPSYAAITAALETAPLESLPPLRLTVLRNIVVEPIEPYLRYLALEIGFNARCQFGQYDHVFQEAVGGAPALLNEETDCVFVALQLDTLAWDLARNPLALDGAQLVAETRRVKDFIDAVLQGIRRQTQALILWTAFERPLYPARGILDYQDPQGQTAVVQELNDHLRDRLHGTASAYLLDLNVCVARVGAARFYDARYWHIGKAPYAREALDEIASEIFRYLRPLKGRSKKCLVLDCDGVLWGGVLGEDGLAGIKLGPTYPGSMYAELQQELLNLYRRGLLLALCSRNNEADVWEVFDRHPGMVLRREHIAGAQINWRDKSTNIRQIALDLNIGLDSLVFLDDSPFEAGLVRQLVPEVHVVELPKDRAVEYRDILASLGWCESLTLSGEDRRRTGMIHAEQARRQQRAESADVASYLASLEMTVTVRLADDFSLPRIAQLTQKTNQFNLTTRRYSEADLRQLSRRDDADVVSVSLRDRFGDMGLVGVGVLQYAGATVTIDSFLLSCRALGRGIEDAFLTHCLRHARQRGCRFATADYRATPKNGQVADFYPRHGFTLAADDGPVRSFHLDLSSLAELAPPFAGHIESALAGAEEATAQRLKKRGSA